LEAGANIANAVELGSPCGQGTCPTTRLPLQEKILKRLKRAQERRGNLDRTVRDVMGPNKEAACDVFLSHRCPDTKRDFSIWLRKELEDQKIRTFFDDRSLQAGDDAPAAMDAAMQAAEWGVIVLSPGFVASGYCMKELKMFLHRGRAILIGFNLKADDCKADLIVEKAKGSIWEQLGERLWENCSKGGHSWSEEKWRDVVRKAAKTTILQLHKFDGYWDKCIAEAVRITAQKLGRPVITSGSTIVNTTPYP
jgi:hypothetical protein